MNEPAPDAATTPGAKPATVPRTSTNLRFPPLRPPPTIPDHELLYPIGSGAYGEVWLGRNVVGTLRAVKIVYRDDFPDAHPFEREFNGMRKFEPISRSHDGLIDILQIGRNDADGYFYYVMELADPIGEGDGSSQIGDERTKIEDGEKPTSPTPNAALPSPISQLPTPGAYSPRTLRSELKSRGRMPIGECLDIAVVLAKALAHLHRHGLVHRDVKPSNIIFVNGKPRLADIGLVAGLDEARSYVGTEGYISPQGPGTPQADLYSLGKVLYEISTGLDRNEFPRMPPGLREWPDATAVVEFNEVVLKACDPEPRNRYQTADRMLEDLRLLQRGRSVRQKRVVAHRFRVTSLVLAVAACIAGLAFLGFQVVQMAKPATSAPGIVPGERASIFVLPVRLVGRPAPANLWTRRITDALMDSLSKIRGVAVGPRRSGWVAYPDEELVRNVSRTNDCRHIFTASLRVQYDSFVLETALYDRGSLRPSHTNTFTASTNHLIELERRVITDLTRRLGLRVTTREWPLIDRTLTNNLAALEWIWRGWAELDKGDLESPVRAYNAFREARALDRHYLDALYFMGIAERETSIDQSADRVWPRIKDLASEILDEDPTYRLGRSLRCQVMLMYEWKWKEWAGEYWRLFDESRGTMPFSKTTFRRCVGELEIARKASTGNLWLENPVKGAREADLISLWVHRDYDRGIEYGRSTTNLFPNYLDGYYWLAQLAVEAGQHAEALEAVEKARSIDARQRVQALRGYVLARMGNREEALGVVDGLASRSDYVQPYFLARIHAALGDTEKAIQWLDKAVTAHSEYIVNADWGGLMTDPAFDRLREEPEFKELVKRVWPDGWPLRDEDTVPKDLQLRASKLPPEY